MPALYTTEIPSKTQEDTEGSEREEAKVAEGGEGGRSVGWKGGIRNTEGRSTTPLGGIPGYVLNCCIPNLLVYVCYRVSYSCAAAKERARAALTLCAQCRHKYAIYASVWPLFRCLRDRACESRCAYVCHGWRTTYECAARARDRARARFPADTCTCVYCMVKRGPTFPRTVPVL